MMTKTYIDRIGTWLRAAAFCLTAVLASCNEQVEQLLPTDYPESGTDYRSGRVLLIEIDGASGAAVQQTYNARKLTNLQGMMTNAKYTFKGLADSKQDTDDFTNDRGWANLMTGTTQNGVGIDTVQATGKVATLADLDVPSFLARMKEKKAALRTSLYASDATFFEAFGAQGVDVAQNAGSDEAVKTALLDELAATDAEPSDLIVAQFSGVEQAGLASGFYTESDGSTVATDEVVDAISVVDGYVGEVMTTLKARSNFTNENWLVIVTSNYGGVPDTIVSADYYYDYANRNTFTLMYNSRFSTKLLLEPSSTSLNYKYFGPIFTGSDYATSGYTVSASVEDPTLFDIDLTKGSYTVQFMYYNTVSSSENYGQVFLSKAPTSAARDGWAVINDYFRYYSLVDGTSAYSAQNASSVLNDGYWHTGTFVFENDAELGYIFKMYKDGELDMYGGVTYKKITNPTDTTSCLTVGFIKSGSTSSRSPFYLTNIQFYNCALPADFIEKNHGRTRLEEVKNEYWDNLIGYWPNDREEDFGDDLIKNYSQYADPDDSDDPTHMHFSSQVTWNSGESYEVNLSPTPDTSYYTAVFNTTDVAYQACQWLGVSIDSDWGWDGTGWTLDYSELN